MTKHVKLTNNKEKTSAYHHNDLRNALIENGLEILSKEGVNGLSLRKVASRTGVSHNAPYRHFKNKDVLMKAIADEVGGKFKQCIADAIARFPDDYRNQFIEMGWAYVLFGLKNPDQFRVMFGSFTGRECESLREAFELLVDIIRRGQKAGVFVDDKLLDLAMASWAMVHGLVMIMIDKTIIPSEVWETTTKERLARASVRILFKGMEKV